MTDRPRRPRLLKRRSTRGSLHPGAAAEPPCSAWAGPQPPGPGSRAAAGCLRCFGGPPAGTHRRPGSPEGPRAPPREQGSAPGSTVPPCCCATHVPATAAVQSHMLMVPGSRSTPSSRRLVMSSTRSACFLQKDRVPASASGVWSRAVSPRITTCTLSVLGRSRSRARLQWRTPAAAAGS